MTAQTHDQNQLDCNRKAQTSPYAQSMDAIRLTPEQKAELVDAVLAQYAASAVARETDELGAAPSVAALGTAATVPASAAVPAQLTTAALGTVASAPASAATTAALETVTSVPAAETTAAPRTAVSAPPAAAAPAQLATATTGAVASASAAAQTPAAAAPGTAEPARASAPQTTSAPAEPSPAPATPTPRVEQAHAALVDGRPVESAPSPALPQTPAPRAPRVSRRSFVALLSAAAVGVGAAGAAFALNQAHVSVSDILETFFGGGSGSGGAGEAGDAGDSNIASSGGASEPAIGSPIGASATCDGVTVTVDSAVGDATNAAVVLTIEREDGSDLGATHDPDTGMPMVEFGMDTDDYQAAVAIDGITKCSTGRFTYDADPTDNAVQVMLNISVNAPLSLIGRTAHLHIADLRDSGSGAGSIEEWPVIAQGPWDIDFTLDYEDSTCLYTCDGTVVNYESIDATLSSVRVSKVCATLEFAIVIHADQAESLDEQMGWESEFVNLPFSLVMDDGQEFSNGYDETSTGPGLGEHSRITVDYSAGLDPDDPSGDFDGIVTRQLFFKRVIDPSRVSAVILNGTRIGLEQEPAEG